MAEQAFSNSIVFSFDPTLASLLEMTQTDLTPSSNLSNVSSPGTGHPPFCRTFLDGHCYDRLLDPRNFLPSPFDLPTLVTLQVLYGLVISLSVVGNSLVIITLTCMRNARSFTDTLLMSLAASDLLISAVNMPAHVYVISVNQWTLGLFMCKLTAYLQEVNVVASVLTLTAIAIDRYIVICQRPLGRRGGEDAGWARVVLLAVWVLALLVACPALIWQHLDPRLLGDGSTFQGMTHVCSEFFPNGDYDERVYSITLYVGLYVLPVCVMVFTYTAIGHKLWVQRPISDVLENPRHHWRLTRKKKKLTVMLMLLVAAFTLLWFPFFTVSLVHRSGSRHRTLMVVLKLIGYSSCCVNPLIYTFLNRAFRLDLCTLLRGRRRRVGFVPSARGRSHRLRSRSRTRQTSVQSAPSRNQVDNTLHM